MGTRTVLALVVVLLFSSTASAQDVTQYLPNFKGACVRCGMESWIDIAQPVTGGLLVAGWGVECDSGRAANRIDVFYEGDDGVYHPVPADFQWLGAVPRADVVAYLQPKCPNVGGTPGFHVYSDLTIPSGTRKIVINVWRGPYMQGHTRVVTIP